MLHSRGLRVTKGASPPFVPAIPQSSPRDTTEHDYARFDYPISRPRRNSGTPVQVCKSILPGVQLPAVLPEALP